MIWVSPATWSDVEWLFHFRNLPELYKRGHTPRPVSMREHREWMCRALRNPDAHKIFIVHFDKIRAGMIRFESDRSGVTAYVSVGILPWLSGRKIGQTAIRIASSIIAKEWGVDRVTAEILKGNPQSERAFEAAGFSHDANLVGGGAVYNWSPS